MYNSKKLQNTLPLILNVKIYIARLALISEFLAPYLFKLLLLSLIFIILTLTEVFTLLPYLLHGLILILFSLTWTNFEESLDFLHLEAQIYTQLPLLQDMTVGDLIL